MHGSIVSESSSAVSPRVSAGRCAASDEDSRRRTRFSHSRQAVRPAMKPRATPPLERAISAARTSVISAPALMRRATTPAISVTACSKRDCQHRHQRDPHQMGPAPHARDQDDDHRGENRDRRRLAQRQDEVVDPSGLRGGQHERIGRAGILTAAPGRRSRIGVHEQCRRQVQHAHDQNQGCHQPPVGGARQAARGIGEHEVHQHRLDHEAGDPTDAVEERVVGLPQRGDRPREPGDDQQRREASPGRPVEHEQADPDRRGDQRGADLGRERRIACSVPDSVTSTAAAHTARPAAVTAPSTKSRRCGESLLVSTFKDARHGRLREADPSRKGLPYAIAVGQYPSCADPPQAAIRPRPRRLCDSGGAPLQRGVELHSHQQREVREPQPDQAHDHRAERTVGAVELANSLT